MFHSHSNLSDKPERTVALSQENEDQWSRRLISLLDFGEVWEAAEPEMRLNTQTPKSKQTNTNLFPV